MLVAGDLQRLLDHQLTQPVDLEAVETGEPGGALDARGPDDQVGREEAAAPRVHALGAHPFDLLAGVDLDPESAQLALGRELQPLGQGRQHARRRLDQAHLDVLVGIEAAQAVAGELARGMAELGGELDARGTRADDREAQPLPGTGPASAWPRRNWPKTRWWIRSAWAEPSR